MGKDCPLIVAMNVVYGHLVVVFTCCLSIPNAKCNINPKGVTLCGLETDIATLLPP